MWKSHADVRMSETMVLSQGEKPRLTSWAIHLLCEDVAKPDGLSVLACQELCALLRRVRRITLLCGFVIISISSCEDRLLRF